MGLFSEAKGGRGVRDEARENPNHGAKSSPGARGGGGEGDENGQSAEWGGTFSPPGDGHLDFFFFFFNL